LVAVVQRVDIGLAYGGHEHAYSFNEADAPDRHDLQYFEMFANLPVASRSG
jgi:hypothetical protein